MGELFHQLGVSSNLLIAQVINFALLFGVLSAFVYRPLLRLVHERSKKIELGLKGAEEAEKKLGEIEVLKTEIVKDANKKGQEIISQSEQRAGEKGAALVREAEQKSGAILEEAALIASRLKDAEMVNLSKEAKQLVRLTLEKTVGLSPEAIDEKLIEQALGSIKN